MLKKIVAAAGLSAALPLSAQNKPESVKDSVLYRDMETVVIIGNAIKTHTHIQRKKLDAMQGNSLGETLSHVSGVQNFSYGTQSGSPMIRSLTGNRVKILRDDSGMNDFSGISPNLGADLDPENIKSIEVYKNAASVRFGGKAIGGAVHIETQTIPEQIPDKTKVSITLDGSSNNGFRQNISVKGKAGKNWVWHFGGMNYDRETVRIPENAKSDICKNPEYVGFDPLLQAMCQVQVASEHVLNISIFPYLSQYALDHINDPEYGLSPNDIYTFEPKYFSYDDFQYHDNPKNPHYIPGQDPVKDKYKDVVSSITDYVALKKGELPNSRASRRSVFAGLGYRGEDFSAGMSYQGDYSYFGLPVYAQLRLPDGHSHGKKKETAPEPYLPVYSDIRSHTLHTEMEYRKPFFLA